MDAAAQLRQDLGSARQFLEGTIGDVSQADAIAQPGGTAHSIAANFGHVLFALDGIVNGMLAKKQPLFASSMAGKTGASEPAPAGPGWDAWARTAKFDIGGLREYGKAVFDSVDAYLSSARDSDLVVEVDMGPGGKHSAGRLCGIMVGNVWMHTGEIACLKGMSGKRGYPM